MSGDVATRIFGRAILGTAGQRELSVDVHAVVLTNEDRRPTPSGSELHLDACAKAATSFLAFAFVSYSSTARGSSPFIMLRPMKY